MTLQKEMNQYYKRKPEQTFTEDELEVMFLVLRNVSQYKDEDLMFIEEFAKLLGKRSEAALQRIYKESDIIFGTWQGRTGHRASKDTERSL